ncbi:hypothetical protein [Microcystis sp. M_QC_C_20170808_M2Col]|uniref:hypothetical protein n=1 Tax=Microcystis sp. M_QC_C_20170808_M2Col TaxID=2486215 RepID=UPI00257F8F00|nr:hypothetical protein [Microcystis sp. M_QC_C_20170808_M2Col]
MWGFTSFEVVNYLIFREKVPEFSPDPRNGWRLLTYHLDISTVEICPQLLSYR